MVIANSDSCGTLVSLEGSGKHELIGVVSTHDARIGASQIVRTEILLPRDDIDDDEYCWDDYCNEDCSFVEKESTKKETEATQLHLIVDEPVETSLRAIPSIMSSADELLANPPIHLSHENQKERILYVGQGEMAHATSEQCDIIVSDKATTCHIMALRSTCACTNNQPLVSLTHIDGTQYEDSIREMVKYHQQYHKHRAQSSSSSPVQMDIHVVGGYGSSQEQDEESISDFLLGLLAQIAAQERSNGLEMTLQTCAVSSMNGWSSPIGRGMAMDCHSGRVFLAKVDPALIPCRILRSARLWRADNHDKPCLTCIHDATHNHVYIQPFIYQPIQDSHLLLKLPDEILLQYTSTSPQVEEDDFCQNIRSTLEFVNSIPHTLMFGRTKGRSPIYLERQCSDSRQVNTWKRRVSC